MLKLILALVCHLLLSKIALLSVLNIGISSLVPMPSPLSCSCQKYDLAAIAALHTNAVMSDSMRGIDREGLICCIVDFVCTVFDSKFGPWTTSQAGLVSCLHCVCNDPCAHQDELPEQNVSQTSIRAKTMKGSK